MFQPIIKAITKAISFTRDLKSSCSKILIISEEKVIMKFSPCHIQFNLGGLERPSKNYISENVTNYTQLDVGTQSYI